MKLKKLIYAVPLAAMVMVAGTSCRKSMFNINKEANNPTDSSITYDVVLPAALHASGSLVATQWGPLQNYMGYWARSGTYAPNVLEETYQITNTFGNGVWNSAYDNNYDYSIIQSKAHVAGANMYEAIARIMKAQNFQILVDVYGNVPYSQSLKGSGNPTPAYDDGLNIYKDLFRQVDTAISLLIAAPTPTATSPDHDIWKNDIMFGDPSATSAAASGTYLGFAAQKRLWIQLGNSLKLRWLIHAYAVAGIDKTVELAKIMSTSGNFLAGTAAPVPPPDLGNDIYWLTVDAQINPGYKSDKPMPFYATYKANAAGTRVANNVYYGAQKWGIDQYNGNGDPRVAKFYEAPFVGVPYGLPPVDTYADGKIAKIGPGLYKTPSGSQIFMSAAEVWFLRAEARFRNFITAGATTAQLLRSGIVASFVYHGLTATQADTYINGNAGYSDVDINSSAANTGYAGGLGTILAQKWFALNGIATFEVWTDWRRVPFASVYGTGSTTNWTYGLVGGYPAGPPPSVSPQLPPGAKIPVRWLYPQTEYNYNPTNVGAQGTITSQSRVFWDLN